MIDVSLDKELRIAFQRLDVHRIHEIAARVGTSSPVDDFARVIFAFGALAAGDAAGADAWLGGTTGDGTASLADLAYVRAFSREQEGNYGAVVETLAAHLADPRATHPARMRLRVADALLKLRRFDELQSALAPLMEPPGVPETLEAHFVVLEAMLKAGAEKEKLIEHVVMVDALLEKGFRLSDAPNVVYYANLLSTNRIEPPIAAMLNGHAALLDAYETEDRDEMQFLLTAGEKYKAPAAVRAAGRSYAKHPFPWDGIDGDRASYMFSTHEEHEAARQSILFGYPKSRINKSQDLWGPLILTTYHAGRWKETLDILRDHRAEIAQLPLAANAMMLRASCEFQLGRYAEAIATARGMEGKFFDEASGQEGALEALGLAALGRTAEIVRAAERAFAAKKDDAEWMNSYATAVLTELMIFEREDALREWLKFLTKILRADMLVGMLHRIGDMAVEWAMPAIALAAADMLQKLNEPARAAVVRGFAAAEQGREVEFEMHMTTALDLLADQGRNNLLFTRARGRWRFGRREEALADLEGIIATADHPRRHVALALRSGILGELGRSEESAIASEAALEMVRQRASNPDAATIMLYEIGQVSAGESAESYLTQARSAEQKQKGSVETLRLGRKTMRAFGANAEVRQAAEELVENWKKENLGR
ncbi:hypothetical protein BH09SUM1_BH09SUM1_31640 [soil metagenome]